MKKYIYTLLALFFMTSCLKDEKIYTGIQVQLDFPEEFADMDRTPIVVNLRNTSNGVQYKSNCDANGIASFNAEYGFYEANFQHKHIADDGVIHIFNGRFENIVLSRETEAQAATPFPMEIITATTAQVIIKEFYHFGCIGNDGKNYTYDTYLSIYNNSNKVAYLDSICIGMVTPMTSNSPSKFVYNNGVLMDSIPLDQMAWQFPGTGKDYPLQPGEECVIAYSAINHKALHPNSIDLSKADYAFWTEKFDMSSAQVQKPAIGVKHLECIWRTKENTKAFPIANAAKAMILFKIEGVTAAQYVANPKNITKAPGGTSSSLDYLRIPKQWVLDGIECVTSADKNNKRLVTRVDAGYFFIEGGAAGCGLAAIRKVEEVVDGRIIYQDTNNSTLDLETTVPSWKNK
ncbi:DUF4876 domain-containing protein [Butyricimonas synergistica]|uniref:DUF4876 domain-containing protein n=1 Tax=Butyricimonas synergistica TaxID=544644 RepID=UPI0003AAFA69|nr:DUF4876 domain-containing protein [Butyricimonas synergistica]